ncbi:hypothetical protein EBF04_03770 [Streptomyces sp. I6]|nr:hypothetical protein EBF04_03770 [Streptomyces sp. I6]
MEHLITYTTSRGPTAGADTRAGSRERAPGPVRPHGADLRGGIQPGVGVRRRERPVDPGTLNKPFDGRVPPFGMG